MCIKKILEYVLLNFTLPDIIKLSNRLQLPLDFLPSGHFLSCFVHKSKNLFWLKTARNFTTTISLKCTFLPIFILYNSIGPIKRNQYVIFLYWIHYILSNCGIAQALRNLPWDVKNYVDKQGVPEVTTQLDKAFWVKWSSRGVGVGSKDFKILST